MAEETEGISLDPVVLRSGVREVFDNPSLGSYFVAESDDQVIASTLITPEWSDWRNGEIWWIQSVYVVPSARSRGVFRGMFEFLWRLAAEDPRVRGIRLYVDRSNESAQEVYRRLGMDGDHYQVFERMKQAE